jgi:transposase
VGRRRGLKGVPGRGTLEKEKPPIFGMVQRGGAVVLHLLADVQQATIKPLILAGVALGSLINTDEDAIYGRLLEWGFGHKTVHHGRGE